MRIEIDLDQLRPPAGTAVMREEPVPAPPDDTPAAATSLAFTGWLGLLRALERLLAHACDDSRPHQEGC